MIKKMTMNDRSIMKKLIPQTCSVRFDRSCTGGITNKLTGSTPNIRVLLIELSGGGQKSVVLKKTSGMIVLKGSILMSRGNMLLLAELVMSHKIFGYKGSYLRESCIYEHFAKEFRSIIPEYYGSLKRHLRHECYICIEKFSVNSFGGMKDYTELTERIAHIAAFYYLYPDKINGMMLNRYTAGDYKRGKHLLRKMYVKLDNTVFGELECVLDDFLGNLDIEFSINRGVKTISHNDFSDRNRGDDGNIRIDEWGLACVQNPEHDLVEFLVSVAHKLKNEEIAALVGHFCRTFYGSIDKDICDEEFNDILIYNLLEYSVNKLTLLRTAALNMELSFTKIYEKNVIRLYALLKENEKNGQGT